LNKKNETKTARIWVLETCPPDILSLVKTHENLWMVFFIPKEYKGNMRSLIKSGTGLYKIVKKPYKEGEIIFKYSRGLHVKKR